MPTQRRPGELSALRRLGDAVVRHRIVGGLTQEDVSDRADVSVAFLRSLERGRANPSYLTLVRISQAIGVAVDALIREAQDARSR